MAARASEGGLAARHPHEVIDRPKGYFPVPALKYIQAPTLDMVRDTLTSRRRASAAVRPGLSRPLFADPPSAITPLRGSELWQVALLEMWLQSHELISRVISSGGGSVEREKRGIS
jgi:asparagine synthase (glutamine-hydrolysing)